MKEIDMKVKAMEGKVWHSAWSKGALMLF